MEPKDRVIVALDVPTIDQALKLVDELDGLISFYKVGLELLMSGKMESLLSKLVKDKKVFVDLKLPSDIPETVKRVVDLAAVAGVSFLTLSHSATSTTIRSAVEGRGDRRDPKLLFVPFLSSLDREDFSQLTGEASERFEKHLEDRTAQAAKHGADGFIVSGKEIGLFRRWYPNTLLVSPGIREAGAPTDDHKRSCTPAEAIELGADYIVVGRPIRNAPNRRDAAQRIVDQVAAASGGAGPSMPGRASSRTSGGDTGMSGRSAGASPP